MFSRSAWVYHPFIPSPSDAVLPGAVAYAIKVPLGAFIKASPFPLVDRVQLRSKGLFRQASRIMIFTVASDASMFANTLSACTQSYSTYLSDFRFASDRNQIVITVYLDSMPGKEEQTRIISL